MRSDIDSICKGCPYYKNGKPLELENNKSDILLVFQAPGEEEWKKNKPIQPTKKKGGTAGRRIELSWQRKKKSRGDYNITNVVQCFPGKQHKSTRDNFPNSVAICKCKEILENDIIQGQYSKIITFGDLAKEIVDYIVLNNNLKIKVINSKHPTGGLKNIDLDNLW